MTPSGPDVNRAPSFREIRDRRAEGSGIPFPITGSGEAVMGKLVREDQGSCEEGAVRSNPTDSAPLGTRVPRGPGRRDNTQADPGPAGPPSQKTIFVDR